AATTRIGADGPFGPPVPITGGLVPCGGNVFALSTDDEVVGPSAAMGAAGNGWIAWNSHCGAYARSIQGGGFGTPLGAGFMAGDGGSIVGPALGVDPTSGVGVLAFREEHTSPVPVTERSLSFLGGGALGEPKQIAGNVREVGLTVGSAGEPVATWIASGDGVYVRDGEAGPVRVSPAGQDPAGAYPQVVSSPDGTLVVAWRDLEGDVWAAVRHAGVWGAPQQLSDPHAEDVHVAIAADDVAYVTWRREVSQIEGVEASVMDPGDPTRSPGDPWGFQPTAEVVVDPAEGTLPSLINSEVTGSALTVRPDGVATVALTWANSLPGHTNTHVVGVIESTAPVGILGGETPGGGGDGGSGGGIGGGSGGSTSGKPAPGRDTRPPALTVFNATRKFFATGTKLDKKVAARGDKTVIDNGLPKAGLQVGTVFKWTQDEAGKARLSIVYEGCAITGAKTAPGYKTCTDKEKGGKVVYRKTVAATRGANKLTYLGAAQKGLIPSGGVYKAKLVAVDAAGNAS
ncbi:MAG: hypothetical protein J0H06_15880, partial [Actinobacteria bacterium]|nr:hypothetical protein [Actinomycetota bacterium]